MDWAIIIGSPSNSSSNAQTNPPPMNILAQNTGTSVTATRPTLERPQQIGKKIRKEDYINLLQEYYDVKFRNEITTTELEEHSKNKREYSKQKCEQKIKHRQEVNTLREKLSRMTVQSEEAQKLRKDVYQLTEKHNMQQEQNKLKLNEKDQEIGKLSGRIKELEEETFQLKTRSPLTNIPHKQKLHRELDVQNSQISASNRISKPKTMPLLDVKDKIKLEENQFKLREMIGKLSTELTDANQEIKKLNNKYEDLLEKKKFQRFH